VRVHEDFGREFGGVFVDGAYLATSDVINLANHEPPSRAEFLARAKDRHKNVACEAVEAYMQSLHVNRDELIRYFEQRPTFRFG
jgi:hypothetical protein